MTIRSIAALALFAAIPLTSVSAQAQVKSAPCATPEQAKNIRAYYEKLRPGVPVSVASRYFNVPESIIASGLPEAEFVGTASNAALADEIWKSIESWGADAQVSLVVAPNGKHAFAFPSLVPIDQNDSSDGYLDVYADSGKGVHSHIQIAEISAIYAHDVPNEDPKVRTRGVSFFGPQGDLIIAVYASIRSGPVDPKAAAGFARTWDLIKSKQQICRGS